MSLYQFNALEEKEQYQMPWDMGVVIADRFTDKNKLLLHQIEGFYVELTYDTDMNKIVILRTFASVSQLEPYLGYIQLPERF